MFRLLVAACVPLAGALAPALAQTPPPAPARPDPLDARAAVPAPAVPTALRRYRPAVVPEPTGWRDANDAVSRIGGWKTYLREAQAPEPPASARPASAAPTPAPAASNPARGHRHGHH